MKVPKTDRYKTVCLETTDTHEARDKAFDYDAELRFKVKHDMPVFDRTFSQVAKEYCDWQKQRADAGEITKKRWEVEDGFIRNLNRYVGNDQITLIGEEKWRGFPLWRRSQGLDKRVNKVSDWTIRSQMKTFRAVMMYAVRKKYISAERLELFRGRLKLDKPRGEAFTLEEYRALYTHAREWQHRANSKKTSWYRQMFYNFMLIMANTGLRPAEAKNLRWRDVGEPVKGKNGKQFLPLRVRGKGKFRELVAPITVSTYIERIRELVEERFRELGKQMTPDDFVFIAYDGSRAKSLYASMLNDLLGKEETNLQLSAAGKRRNTYSFRHTFATFRLMHGTDVYFLAKQMGTSVQMIEDYYGHITPVKNADAILQGLPGWEATADASGETEGSVNADRAGSKKPARPRTKK
jgi:integrase